MDIYDPYDGDPAPSFNSFSDFVMRKACLAEVLAEDGSVITRTGGFYLREPDGIYFYTCWHSVTGIDFLNPHPLAPPQRRRHLRILSKTSPPPEPGKAIPIGGSRSEDVELYDANDSPVWQQEEKFSDNPDVESLGFRVPATVDVVRIPVTLEPHIAELLCFDVTDIRWFPLILPGNDVAIMGFPYGFSIDGDDSPSALFLKRSIAANTKTVYRVLLDGFGFEVMSGSPVFAFHKQTWWLYGVYTGKIRTDAARRDNRVDEHAAMGIMTPMVGAWNGLGIELPLHNGVYGYGTPETPKTDPTKIFDR